MDKKILTARQELFLQLFGEAALFRSRFYLSGGTALAAFYLHHRYSEDLDFFAEEEFEVEALQVFLQQIKQHLGFHSIDFQQSFNRNLFFLHFEDEILKTEFTFWPFPRIEPAKNVAALQIDSLLDIAVNKLFSIYQRTVARDYIDLYCICQEKGWEIGELAAQAKIKFDWHVDPLQLGTQFMKATEAKDYPRLLIDLAPKTWQGFFVSEAKRLKSQVLD